MADITFAKRVPLSGMALPEISSASVQRNRKLLLLLSVGTKLANIGPKVLCLALVLDAGKDHLGAGNFCPRILDVVDKGRFIPFDTGVFIGIRIAISRDRSCLTTGKAVQYRPDLIFRCFPDIMTCSAL